MAITFERDPLGWIHPFYRRRALLNDDFFEPTINSKFSNIFDMSPLSSSVIPRVVISKGEKFEVKLDVQQFAPQELDVKLVDNMLVIEGKHEEKQDEHGFISRHFLRKYTLPSDVKGENLTCDLSSDGVLQISAPRQIEENKGSEKVIPITYTGQPALTIEGKDKEKKAVAAAC